jgi:3-hydroxyacyl-[acyl-carrier-protein] dehydratase
MREQIRLSMTRHDLQAGLPWASFTFSIRFPGFDGHFPGQPVLPGVCMLTAVVVTLEEWLGLGVRVFEVRKARFLSPINPGQPLEIKCTQHKQTADTMVAQFTLRGAGDRKTSECTIHYTLK